MNRNLKALWEKREENESDSEKILIEVPSKINHQTIRKAENI